MIAESTQKAAVFSAILLGVTLVAGAALGFGLSVADVIGIVFFGIGGLLVWRLAGLVSEAEDYGFLPKMVVLAQGVRTMWCVLKHTIFADFHRKFLEWEDAYGRHFAAMAEARSWYYGLARPRLPSSLSESHSYLVQLKTSVLYYLFGPSPLLPEALIVTGTTSICIAVYLIMVAGGVRPLARRLPVSLLVFLPSFSFWYTLDNKDAVTATCAAWSTVGLLWALQGGARTAGGLLLLVMMDLLAVAYRPYVGLLLAVGQGLAWAWSVKLPPTALGAMTRVWLFLMAAPVAVWLGNKEMKEAYGEQMGVQWAVEQYGVFRETAEQNPVAGSEYEIPLTASGPAAAIAQLPIRVLLLLFTPIPLFPGTPRRMLTYPEMWFIYLFVVPRLYWGMRAALRLHRGWAATVLVSVVPVIIACSLKTALSGEAMRMRVQFLPELLIFAGIGHVILQARRAVRAGEHVPRQEAGAA
jgi:hypothetical protein